MASFVGTGRRHWRQLHCWFRVYLKPLLPLCFCFRLRYSIFFHHVLKVSVQTLEQWVYVWIVGHLDSKVGYHFLLHLEYFFLRISGSVFGFFILLSELAVFLLKPLALSLPFLSFSFVKCSVIDWDFLLFFLYFTGFYEIFVSKSVRISAHLRGAMIWNHSGENLGFLV